MSYVRGVAVFMRINGIVAVVSHKEQGGWGGGGRSGWWCEEGQATRVAIPTVEVKLHGGSRPGAPQGAHKGQVSTPATSTIMGPQPPCRQGVLVTVRGHQQAQGGAGRQAEPLSTLRLEGGLGQPHITGRHFKCGFYCGQDLPEKMHHTLRMFTGIQDKDKLLQRMARAAATIHATRMGAMRLMAIMSGVENTCRRLP